MTGARPGTTGVGVLGAGPVVQAIHLPTLARLSDLFTVTHVMDVSAAVAESVADRVGATWSTSAEDLLADPQVEVVAICSPSQFHAAQVTAAMRAGKRAVLCEKPFATSRNEAEEIIRVSNETGVPVVVGAMHTFDPAWLGIEQVWGALPDTAHAIRSSIVLPPNALFEDWATEVLDRPEMSMPSEMTVEMRADFLAGGVLGLAIHDLPLVRRFLGDGVPEVTSARALSPFGYAITLRSGDRVAQLVSVLNAHWEPRWDLEVVSTDQLLRIDFTPSYVHAGSATATLEREGRPTLVVGPAEQNGYEGEWRAIADLLRHGKPIPSRDSLIDDLDLAISIAEQSRSLVLKEASA